MRFSALDRLAMPWFGALLAFLTLGIGWPQTARAGCSSHQVADPSRATGARLGLELLEPLSTTSANPEESPGERRAPCSGAFCSENPVPPSSPLPPAPDDSSREWAIAAFADLLVGPGSFMRPRLDAGARPIDRRGTIFHPPRRPAPCLPI